jgi:hypothetical protein
MGTTELLQAVERGQVARGSPPLVRFFEDPVGTEGNAAQEFHRGTPSFHEAARVRKKIRSNQLFDRKRLVCRKMFSSIGMQVADIVGVDISEDAYFDIEIVPFIWKYVKKSP